MNIQNRENENRNSMKRIKKGMLSEAGYLMMENEISGYRFDDRDQITEGNCAIAEEPCYISWEITDKAKEFCSEVKVYERIEFLDSKLNGLNKKIFLLCDMQMKIIEFKLNSEFLFWEII